MVKIFRQTRQTLINDEKVTKYLLYAIGEIILVVIGILIALQLDTAKELKDNKEQIKGILFNIAINLDESAMQIAEVLDYIEENDSLANIILKKELSAADYVGDIWTNSFIGLTRRSMEVVHYNSTAYERLMGNIEIIPDEFDEMIKLLHHVYNQEIPIAMGVEREVKTFLSSIEDELRISQAWYSMTEPEHQKRAVDYYLNDPIYLNNVYRLKGHLTHLTVHLYQLRSQINLAYNEMYWDLFSETPFAENITKIEPTNLEELDEYTGVYVLSGKMNSQSPDTLRLVISDGMLMDETYEQAIIKNDTDRFIPTVSIGMDIYLDFYRTEQGEINTLEVSFPHLDKRDSIVTELFYKISE